jgi:hypothetical protein
MSAASAARAVWAMQSISSAIKQAVSHFFIVNFNPSIGRLFPLEMIKHHPEA